MTNSRRVVARRRPAIYVSALLGLLFVVTWLGASFSGFNTRAVTYDLVLAGGRVIDPATGLDAARYLAISDGKVAAVSTTALQGKQVLDVKGLVVAPGFIDLHAHGQNVYGQTYQARDGVTTALDLEIGAYPLDALRERVGKALINYGYSAGHTATRLLIKK